jgi:hypothetical protein
MRNHTMRDQDVSWDGTWTYAETMGESVWQAEIAIPYQSLGRTAPPKSGERWRLNCSIASGDLSHPKLLAVWGDRDPARVEHGILLIMSQGSG